MNFVLQNMKQCHVSDIRQGTNEKASLHVYMHMKAHTHKRAHTHTHTQTQTQTSNQTNSTNIFSTQQKSDDVSYAQQTGI